MPEIEFYDHQTFPEPTHEGMFCMVKGGIYHCDKNGEWIKIA